MKKTYFRSLFSVLRSPLSVLTWAALIFSSCDRIENDNRLIFSGAVGEWYDGTPVEDHTHRALLEKYTGVRCVNCPTADVEISNSLQHFGHSLIAVSIHDSCTFTRPYEGDPDMRTSDGNELSHFFGVFNGDYPNALVSRTKKNTGEWDLFTPTAGVDTRVETIVNTPAAIALDVTAQAVDNDGNITIKASIEFLESCSDTLTLTLFVMEDGIVASQLSTEGKINGYVHNHILRDIITDWRGTEIQADGKAGTCRYAIFQYKIDTTQWNPENCHIVAFVSNKNTMLVLNAAECSIE